MIRKNGNKKINKEQQSHKKGGKTPTILVFCQKEKEEKEEMKQINMCVFAGVCIYTSSF